MLVEDPVLIAAVLCGCVLVSELLCMYTALRHLGTALLVIVVTAMLANTRVIPAANSPVYDGIFAYVAPLCIFWLLLRVNLKSILGAGWPMLLMFGIGAVGTTLGVLVGMWVAGGQEAFGESYRALGAMFVGTYVGGSINFNALAMEYKVNENGMLYAGAMAVDSILTTVWMVATIAIPKLVARLRPNRRVWFGVHATSTEDPDTKEAAEDAADDGAYVTPIELSLLLGVGLLAVWVSDWLGAATRIPSVLHLTTIALILAQLPAVARFKGSRLLGMFAVYLFLATIGAFCDLSAVRQSGALGVDLMIFVSTIVAVHGVVVYVAGTALRADLDMVSVASQANIGGGTSALALARSLERPELVLPAILIGALGNGVGTYLGWITAEQLL